VMFQIATGAIYLAGAGAIIIGGLYWSRGTSAGAWAAMISGAVFMVISITIRQIEARTGSKILNQPNPQIVSLMAMGVSSVTYIVVSLASCRRAFNLDRMLHRGEWSDAPAQAPRRRKGLFERLGINSDFSRGDIALALTNMGWAVFWSATAWVVAAHSSRHDISELTWSLFWEIKSWLLVVIAAVVTIWITFGGVRDLKYMLHMLKTMPRDDRDDGTVINHANADEVPLSATFASTPERSEEEVLHTSRSGDSRGS